MHDHDLDLIADHLATPSDEARRLIESCPECATEYRLQGRIRDGLARLGSATPTADERTRLHTRIDAALDARVVVSPAAWGRRLASVAAALLVVVGLGRFLTQVSGMGEPAATTAATFEAAASQLSADEGADISPSGDFQVFSSQTIRRELVGEVTLEDVGNLLTGPESDLRQRSQAVDEYRLAGSAPACAQLLEAPVSRVLEATVEGRPLVAYLTADTEPPIAIAYYADTCEAVDLPE